MILNQKMKRLIKLFIAYMHWNDKIVCEMSKGEKDYHDYIDDESKSPLHLGTLKCERCGKEFYI